MATTRIEFKNVGTIDRGINVKEPTKPIGIKTPIRRGERFGLFDMNTDVLEQIKDNFRNLILTNHDERLMNTNFGANLRATLFELNSPVNNSAAQRVAENIKNAVDNFMPYIELEDMEIFMNETDNSVSANSVRIKIAFSVPGLFKDKKISVINLLTTI